MNIAPLSDLAATLRLQRNAARVRNDLDRVGRELASGRKTDMHAAAGRDPGRLYAIESDRARTVRALDGVTAAQGRLGAAQTVLGGLEALADELGVDLQASLARGDMMSARLHASGASDAFDAAVGMLNTRYGGRALFAGAAVDGAALAPPEDILDDVRSLVNGAVDAADAVAQVNAYFDASGGGFETSAYQGSAADAPLASVDDGAAVTVSRRADDPEVRMLLKGLAMIAVAVDPTYAGPADAVPELLSEGARLTSDSRGAIVASRADLGLSEQRLEEASVRLAARRDALDLAWNAATARDPYDAAAEFQALEQQLERVFLITARLSRLNLTEFLR